LKVKTNSASIWRALPRWQIRLRDLPPTALVFAFLLSVPAIQLGAPSPLFGADRTADEAQSEESNFAVILLGRVLINPGRWETLGSVFCDHGLRDYSRNVR
jgi:hypothetical protein